MTQQGIPVVHDGEDVKKLLRSFIPKEANVHRELARFCFFVEC